MTARDEMNLEPNGSCGRCKFYVVTNPTDGQCRRHAPQAVVMIQQHPITGAAQQVIAGTFPATQPGHWCGEFEAKVLLGVN